MTATATRPPILSRRIRLHVFLKPDEIAFCERFAKTLTGKTSLSDAIGVIAQVAILERMQREKQSAATVDG